MADRREMAKQYVHEMLEKRDDIVGAFVGGSVARGDDVEGADVVAGSIVEYIERS
jgi:predicted nucleotidyltransferase